MKKLTWIMALLITMALVVTGCPGGGDPDDKNGDGDDISAENLKLSATEGGTGVSGNTITTTEANQNIYIYFDPPGKEFDKIAFDFTLNPGGNLTVTALYGMHNDAACTWGKATWDTDWYESGPLTIDTTAFTADWSNTGASGIDKATILGFCVNIAAEATFTLSGVTFTGAKSGGNEGGGEEVISNWYLSETEGGTAASGNSKTGSGTGENAWYVYIYFDPVPEGIATINIDFSTTGGITLIKQCVYDDTGTWGWGWGDVTPGPFTISGTSSWGASGTALDLTTLKGICIKIEGDGTFTLTNVTITKSTD